MRNKLTRKWSLVQRASLLLLKVMPRRKSSIDRSIKEEFEPDGAHVQGILCEKAVRYWVTNMMTDSKTGPDYFRMRIAAGVLGELVAGSAGWGLSKNPDEELSEKQWQKTARVLAAMLDEGFRHTRNMPGKGVDIFLEAVEDNNEGTILRLFSHWMHMKLKVVAEGREQKLNISTPMPSRKAIDAEVERIIDVVVNDDFNADSFVTGQALMVIAKSLISARDAEEYSKLSPNDPQYNKKVMDLKMNTVLGRIHELSHDIDVMIKEARIGNAAEVATNLISTFIDVMGPQLTGKMPPGMGPNL